MNHAPQISIVVPLYNEEDSIVSLVERLDELIITLPFTTEIVLVDDGSTDNTANLITQTALKNERYQGIFLSRNHGHPLALSAGIESARCTEGIMIIDGDLQDPPELITEFYGKMQEGYDVVYGIRKRRKESILKKLSYWLYYRILKSISNIEIPLDSGDFSMINRRVADIMVSMPERSRYLRGMRAWIGFKQVGIEYERQPRIAGKPKYGLKKLFELAYNGIFNFSEFPIKFIMRLGVVTMLISLIYLSFVLFKRVFFGTVPEGFTTLIFAIVLFSGVQLISLGIIGEYVLRIFFEVKKRPLYIVKEKIIDKEVVNG